MEFKARIYTPNKSNNWQLTPSRIIVLGLVIIVITSLVASTLQSNNYIIWQLIALIGFIAIFYGARKNYFSIEPLNGQLTDELTIDSQMISISGSNFNWDKIEKFNFSALDYMKKELFSGVNIKERFFSPSFSSGTNNYISFEYFGEPKQFRFLIETQNKIQNLVATLKPVYFRNRISDLIMQSGFGMSDVELLDLKRLKAHNIG